MTKNQSQPDSPSRSGRRDAGDPHAYRMPTREELSAEGEKALTLTIQETSREIEQLAEIFSEKIRHTLGSCDLWPVTEADVVTQVQKSAIKVINSITANQSNPKVFVARLQQSLRKSLARYLGPHAGNADVIPSVDEWLSAHLPDASLLAAVANAEESWALLSRNAGLRDVAINCLVTAHMPLAKRFAQSAIRRIDELDDLLNEAALILRRCARSFDPASGNRFSSYAKTALLELKRRRPSNATTRYTAQQVQECERKVEPHTGQHIDHQSDQPPWILAPDKVRRAVENARRLLSPGRRSTADCPDPRCQRPSEMAELREDIARMHSALRRLSWMERKVLIGHTLCKRSFREMAKRYRKSPRTISMIHKAAHRKVLAELDPDSLSRESP